MIEQTVLTVLFSCLSSATKIFNDSSNDNDEDRLMYSHGLNNGTDSEILLASYDGNTSNKFCDASWKDFWKPYDTHVHNILFPIICGFGCLTNIANILVFTKKKMRTNPTNSLFFALAVSDLLFVFFAFVLGIAEVYGGHPDIFAVATVIIFNEFTAVLLHATSTYLTLSISLWRLLGILCTMASKRWLTQKTANYVVIFSVIFPCVVTMAMFWNIYICDGAGKPIDPNSTEIFWSLDSSWYCSTEIGAKIYEISRSLFTKMGPSFALTIITIILVIALLRARRSRRALGVSTTVPLTNMNSGRSSNETKAKPVQPNTDDSDRITKIVIGILVVYLLTELPSGVYSLLSGILGDKFSMECHSPLWKLHIMQEYISSAVSFFTYFLMSKNFRQIFLQRLTTSTVPVRTLLGKLTGGQSSTENEDSSEL